MASSLKLGDTTGSVSLVTNSPGTNYTVTLPNENAAMPVMQLMTAQSATGTAIDFTNVPSWAKKVTVMFDGVSTNGASIIQIQLGDSGGIEATGYQCTGSSIAGTVASVNHTTGFGIGASGTSSFIRNGAVTINKVVTNTFSAQGFVGQSDSAQTLTTSGSKTLSAEITTVRITTVNGTDTFDAGSINVCYEGY